MINGAGKFLTYLSKVSINLFSNDIVRSVLSLFNYLGYILLAVGVLFAITNVYLEYLESGCIEVHLTIINTLKAIIAVIFLQAGAIELYDLSITIQSLISNIISTPNYNSVLTQVNSSLGAEFSVIWVIAIFLCVVVSMVVVLVQILKRGGMYMVQIIVGYLYIFSIPSGNTDGFIDWCKQTVAIAVTNVVQVAMLFLGMSLMANDISKIFLGIGVIMSAASVEKIAGRYGLSAGARQHIGSVVRTAGTVGGMVSSIKNINKVG